MSRRRWLTFGVVVIVGVGLLAIVRSGRDRDEATASPGASLAIVATPHATPSAAQATVPATPTAVTTPSPVPTAAPTPGRTSPPRATGDPRLAYTEFLLRVNDDRSTVDGLNRALATAADAQDRIAVRKAAVAILDFVDVERDWLTGHPPAGCYAKAHGSASAMLAAYGAAAEKFIAWAEAGGGLGGLVALGDAVDAAQTAGDALTAFGKVLETTRCAT